MRRNLPVPSRIESRPPTEYLTYSEEMIPICGSLPACPAGTGDSRFRRRQSYGGQAGGTCLRPDYLEVGTSAGKQIRRERGTGQAGAYDYRNVDTFRSKDKPAWRGARSAFSLNRAGTGRP